MKICFISGPYHPQKCGISDYIQLLISEFAKTDIETKEADSLNVKRPQKLTNLLWDIFIRFESSLEPMIAILLLVLPKIKRTSLQNESSPHDFSENPAPGARTILKP